jgi:2-keto-4-pentenoate hydratase/2-oxohepta-3-ene-1,7-dioic acid hydratase in catechol pathway
MKLLFFDDFILGALKGEGVVDLSDVVADIPRAHPQDVMSGLIARFDDYRPRLESVIADSPGIALASVRLRPPLPRPATIDCMAVNYMENGTLPAPPPIQAFQKAPSAIIGPGGTMVLPDVPATIFEGEAELAVVIGKTATQVSQSEAMDYVFGYTNFIDGSARGLEGFSIFHEMKSRDTFAPIGPFITTADEIADPQDLRVRLWNRGELKQDFRTDDMAHSIVRCIEYVTSIHTLEPGDILSTGTNHGGLNPFQDGDVVELECEGMGRLEIRVQDDLKRSWARETRGQRQARGVDEVTPQLSGKYA